MEAPHASHEFEERQMIRITMKNRKLDAQLARVAELNEETAALLETIAAEEEQTGLQEAEADPQGCRLEHLTQQTCRLLAAIRRLVPGAMGFDELVEQVVEGTLE
jgi:hypothetical protein